jgi:hypothetical protein
MCHDRDQWWALVETVKHLEVPKMVENFWSNWETTGFSRRALHHTII